MHCAQSPWLMFLRFHKPLLNAFSCSLYVEEKLGTQYVKKRTIPFETSYEETGPGTPVFFVLSPGVDPLKDVEAVGKKLDFTLTKGNLHNVSLGQVRLQNFNHKLMWLWGYSCLISQGQEVVAESALEQASKEGHWVILQVQLLILWHYRDQNIVIFGVSISLTLLYFCFKQINYHIPGFLQNIHLVARWLPKLEKTLEQYSQGSHESYRVYMSAEPAPTPESHIIPQVQDRYWISTNFMWCFREYWSLPLKSPTNLQLECWLTCTKLSIISTRLVTHPHQLGCVLYTVVLY